MANSVDVHDFIMKSPAVNEDRLLNELKSDARGSFFYPFCGFDCYPLFRFSDRCRVFVYCDRTARTGDLGKQFRNRSTPTNWGLKFGQKREKLDFEFLGLEPSNQSWAYLIEGTHHFNYKECSFLLAYFCADEADTYLRLFSDSIAAPRFLCVKRLNRINQNRRARFRRAVADKSEHDKIGPEFLIAGRGHRWPWTAAVERYNDWEDQPMTYARFRIFEGKAVRRA